MNTLKRLKITVLSIILFSGIGFAAPISAHAIMAGETSTSNSTKADTSATANVDTTDSNTKTTTLREQFRALAQQDLATKKAQVKQQTQADRQKVCEARKTALTARMNLVVKEAQAHKTYFDNVYTKVKAYHDTKKLTVVNYDSLVATVDTDQSNAATSISALQGLDVSVDCTSQTVADSIGTFQQAVKATRDALKTYRTDIIAVITALKAASTTITSGGGQ